MGDIHASRMLLVSWSHVNQIGNEFESWYCQEIEECRTHDDSTFSAPGQLAIVSLKSPLPRLRIHDLYVWR